MTIPTAGPVTGPGRKDPSLSPPFGFIPWTVQLYGAISPAVLVLAGAIETRKRNPAFTLWRGGARLDTSYVVSLFVSPSQFTIVFYNADGDPITPVEADQVRLPSYDDGFRGVSGNFLAGGNQLVGPAAAPTLARAEYSPTNETLTLYFNNAIQEFVTDSSVLLGTGFPLSTETSASDDGTDITDTATPVIPWVVVGSQSAGPAYFNYDHDSGLLRGVNGVYVATLANFAVSINPRPVLQSATFYAATSTLRLTFDLAIAAGTVGDDFTVKGTPAGTSRWKATTGGGLSQGFYVDIPMEVNTAGGSVAASCSYSATHHTLVGVNGEEVEAWTDHAIDVVTA